MFKNYWKMSDEELKKLGRKNNLQYFLEEKPVLTEDRRMENDFVINRKEVIDQLSQRDIRKFAYYSMIFAAVGVLISLIILFK